MMTTPQRWVTGLVCAVWIAATLARIFIDHDTPNWFTVLSGFATGWWVKMWLHDWRLRQLAREYIGVELVGGVAFIRAEERNVE